MKTGFWLKGGSGKLAGATVYKDSASGETIMREVVTPSNPKTEKQIIQRIIMHTVALAYSKMKEICDHSFEGIKKGRDTMGYFIKQNVNIARAQVASMQQSGVDFYDMYNFSKLGQRRMVINAYQVSMGSLPSVPVTLTEDAFIIPGVSENTYEAIINGLGLKRGDQLTFLVVGSLNSGLDDKTFHFARVILDPTDAATGLPLPLSTAFVGADTKVNAPSRRNEGEVRFETDFTNGLSYYIPLAQNEGNAGTTVIVSRQNNDGSWLRSSAYMAYAENMDYSLGECIDDAQRKGSNIYAANEQYLNNAGEDVNYGSTPSAAVSYVTVNGAAAVVGTPLAVEMSEAGEQVNVVVSMNNAVGTTVKVIDSTDTAKATGEIAADGKVTLTFAGAEGTFRVIAANAETGYSFTLAVAPPSGGGGGFGNG